MAGLLAKSGWRIELTGLPVRRSMNFRPGVD
jgi:hypothetical protein